MKQTILTIINNKKFKVSGQAESIDAARNHAINTLEDSPEADVNEVLDYFQNTVLNDLSKVVNKL